LIDLHFDARRMAACVTTVMWFYHVFTVIKSINQSINQNQSNI